MTYRKLSDAQAAAAQRRLQVARDQQEREREIATCECGAQVRWHPELGWVHSGPCEVEGMRR